MLHKKIPFSHLSQDSSTSDQEMEVQSPEFFQRSAGQPQPFVQPMLLPYIEKPKMDWTVNDSFYHSFLKWNLTVRIYKKVIAWSGDFGMDQYVLWCLPPEDLSLDVIWAKYEDFYKSQTNDARARFDLLTSFRQSSDSVDEWYNAVHGQVSLAKYPPETASISHRCIFWFFLERSMILT